MSIQSDPVVAIIHDNQETRDALAVRLAQSGLRCVSFETARAFCERPGTPDIGCVLADIGQTDTDMSPLLRQLAQAGRDLKVIVTADHGAVPMAVEALQLGAVDFIESPLTSSLLIPSIRKALDAWAVCRSNKSAVDEFMARVARLSPRKREVMDRMVLGQSTRMISEKLGISPNTVSAYRARIMLLMGVDELPQLMCAAMTAKNAGVYQILVEPPPPRFRSVIREHASKEASRFGA